MSKLLRKRSFKSVWIILFLFMFLCCSGLLTTWFVAKRTAKKALDVKLTELESKGIPIDDASMADYHQGLNSDKDATQWASIIDMIASKDFMADCAVMPIFSKNVPDIPPMDQTWSELPTVEQFLLKHADTINSLIKISQDNGPINLPIKFDSFRTLLPYTQNTRAAVRVLTLEAQVAARQHDAEREFRAINAMFGCSIALRGQPFLVSQVSMIAYHGLATDQLQSAVQLNRLKPEHYEQLRARLVQFNIIRQPFVFALTGELGSMTTAIRDRAILHEQFGGWAPVLAGTGIADRTAVRLASQMEEAIEIDTNDLGLFFKQAQEFESKLEVGSSRLNVSRLIMNHYMPAVAAFSKILVRHKMRNDLAQLAMAIRQHEQIHGRLPASLTELEPLGINLEQYKAVDGSRPNYVNDVLNSHPKAGCRAVLWNFEFDQVDKISPMLPDSIDPNAIGDAKPRWHWDLK